MINRNVTRAMLTILARRPRGSGTALHQTNSDWANRNREHGNHGRSGIVEGFVWLGHAAAIIGTPTLWSQNRPCRAPAGQKAEQARRHKANWNQASRRAELLALQTRV